MMKKIYSIARIKLVSNVKTPLLEQSRGLVQIIIDIQKLLNNDEHNKHIANRKICHRWVS